MKTIAVITIFSLFLASAGMAQDGVSSAPNWSVRSSLHIGQKLQVNTKDGKSKKGTLDKITDAGLTLIAKEKTFSFQSGDIDKIYVFRGRPIASRTAIGAVVGGGSGALFGAIAGRNDDWFGPAAWALVCGGAGLIIGSIVGFATGVSRKKDLVYEANPAHR
jgi:hypothetical protein